MYEIVSLKMYNILNKPQINLPQKSSFLNIILICGNDDTPFNV